MQIKLPNRRYLRSVFKLNSYMDELAGKNGSLENKSLELIGFLNDLQVLMKDDTLFLRIKQCFERKCETLKNVDLIVSKVRNHISLSAKDSRGHLEMEVTFLLSFFSCCYFLKLCI
jgi:hypothetical protein